MPSAPAASAQIPAFTLDASRHRLCSHATRQGFFLISRRSLFTLDLARAAPVQRWVRAHRTIMACRFEVALPEADARHVDAALEALDEADRLEAALTVFRDTSELSRINREAAAAPARASEGLFALLTRCQTLYAETEGAFDITSTPLSRRWGFLKSEAREPSVCLDASTAVVGMNRVRLDATTRTVSFGVAAMELNLGAIGKGYAVDRLGVVLRRRGVTRALVSAGGSSVLAVGGHDDGWSIDLTSPQLESRIARLRLRDAALGTSGAGQQYIVADGVRYGHIFDPRTGRPSHGVLSASVVARDAETADALSTAFLVGGVDLARRYCESHPHILALITLDGATTHVFGNCNGAHIED
jgi:thiamine biosynthesis lipoprotein